MEEKKQHSMKVFGGILSLGLLACVALIVFQTMEIQKQRNQVSGMEQSLGDLQNQVGDLTQKEKEAQEKASHITIANVYDIPDTTALSNALKAGSKDSLTDSRDQQVYDAARKVLDEQIKDAMSPYEKELAIHDYLSTHVNVDDNAVSALPENNADQGTPYGALVNKSAVCIGYASTFKLFMDAIGIPCNIVYNTELDHSWDQVQLDNEWYNVDVTFDSPIGAEPSHTYFNVNDESFKNSHSWDQSLFPAALGTKYSYAAMNYQELNSMYDIPQLAAKALKKKKDGQLFFTLKDNSIDDDIFSVISSISSRLTEGGIEMAETLTINQKKIYTITIYSPSTMIKNNAPAVSNVDQDKLNKVLTDIFGEMPADEGMNDNNKIDNPPAIESGNAN